MADNSCRRSAQTDKAPCSRNNPLRFRTIRSNIKQNMGNKNHSRRHKERHCEELAEHTVERTEGLTADVARMRQMVHTLLTMVAAGVAGRMHVQRRKNQHWQQHRQQHPRGIISSGRLFHGCKGREKTPICQKRSLKTSQTRQNFILCQSESLTEFNWTG